MKKFNYLFIISLLFLSFSNGVSALECSEDEIANYKELAKNVVVSTVNKEEGLDLDLYELTINGLTNELYAVAASSNSFLRIDSSMSNDTYDIRDDYKDVKIYAKKCDKLVRTIKLELKYYNKFSSYSECKDLVDKIDVCAKYVDKKFSYSILKSEIDKYNRKKSIIFDDKKNNIYAKLMYVIIPIIVVLLIVLCIFGIKKIKSKNVLD